MQIKPRCAEEGDCTRASISSLLEINQGVMPNFWEHTQDALEFWRLTNEWLFPRGYKCVVVNMTDELMFMADGCECLAIGTPFKGGGEHAVVWKDGIIHDPHPDKIGIGKPKTFAFLVTTKVKAAENVEVI